MDNKKNSGLKRAIAIALMGTVCLTAAVSVTAMSVLESFHIIFLLVQSDSEQLIFRSRF